METKNLKQFKKMFDLIHDHMSPLLDAKYPNGRLIALFDYEIFIFENEYETPSHKIRFHGDEFPMTNAEADRVFLISQFYGLPNKNRLVIEITPERVFVSISVPDDGVPILTHLGYHDPVIKSIIDEAVAKDSHIKRFDL